MAITPAIKLGIISLVVLAITIVTRYPLHLAWQKTYVIAACAALYFNVFSLVVQSFEKVPALRAICPDAKRASVCDCANRCVGAFCYPDNFFYEEIPHRADDHV